MTTTMRANIAAILSTFGGCWMGYEVGKDGMARGVSYPSKTELNLEFTFGDGLLALEAGVGWLLQLLGSHCSDHNRRYLWRSVVDPLFRFWVRTRRSYSRAITKIRTLHIKSVPTRRKTQWAGNDL
jgi:hypothetical protein